MPTVCCDTANRCKEREDAIPQTINNITPTNDPASEKACVVVVSAAMRIRR
jgi:hypothetical protein